MSELIELYDKNRNKTGTILARNDDNKALIPEGEYFIVTNVVIFNSNFEMLIQKRSENKEKHPGLWDLSAGGHVDPGENSQDCIQRELFEELGIEYDFQNEVPYITIYNDCYIRDIYVIKMDFDVTKLKLQSSEVSNAAWVNLDELKQLYNEEKFVKYYWGFMETLYNMQFRRGVKIKKEKIN